MLSLIILYVLLCVVSVFLLNGSGIQQFTDAGFFDYLNIMFFNSEKFSQYYIDWNIVSVMHFFLFLFFGVIFCSSSARNYYAGMNQMEFIRYGKYEKYFFSCNLRNAQNALKFVLMTVLLPLSIVFVNSKALIRFDSIIGNLSAENILNIVVFLVKTFALLMLIELVFLVLIRKRDYQFSLSIMAAVSAIIIFADSLMKTGFVTLGKTVNQLIATGVYTALFLVLYAVFKREPKSI
ncbi:MAG: hypothetical protein J1F03_03640 [Oscillospiraceae bacterium]|nr:hypothetical protein [Oscillospiraceae bacterium]